MWLLGENGVIDARWLLLLLLLVPFLIVCGYFGVTRCRAKYGKKVDGSAQAYDMALNPAASAAKGASEAKGGTPPDKPRK